MARDPYRRWRRRARRAMRKGEQPYPVMMFGPDEPFGTIAAVAISRWLYRHRSALVPILITGAAFATALLTHPRHGRYWIPVAVLTVLGTVLLGISHQLLWSNPAGKATAGFLARMWAACGIDRPAERAYATCAVAVAGGWLSAGIAIGPTVRPLPEIAVISTVILGIPWWIHRRRRARVRVDRAIDAWPDIGEAIGLAGSHIASVVADAWGWTARIILRKGTSAEEAIAKIPAIESGLGVRRGSVRVFADDTRADAVVLRVIETDPHSVDIPWPGTENISIAQLVELGLSEGGEPVHLWILRRHILIGGIAGAGKSGILNIILAVLAACRDVEIWGVDLKGGMELKPWAICMNRLATTPEQANELFRDAVRRLNERAERMAREGKRVWEPTPHDPALVIVVDEYAELPEESHDCADSIARRGRAVAETLIAATQRPSQEAMGKGAVRSQMDVRICLRVRERRDTDLILGQGSFNAGWHAHALTRPGEFLVSDPEHTRPERARAYLLSDARVTEHARDHSRVQLAGDDAGAPEWPYAEPQGPQAAGTAPDPTRVWAGVPDGAETALWAALVQAGPRGASIADLILGQGSVTAGWHAHSITRPGVFLVSAPEHTQPQRALAYLVDDARVTRHTSEYHTGRPVLGPPPGAPESTQPGEDPQPGTTTPPDPDKVLWDALSAAGPRGVPAAHLMAATGKGRTWVYERIRHLADAGRAIQTIRGHWRAADDHPDDDTEDYAQ